MRFSQLLAAATLTLSSVCAFATPVYTGDTDAAGFSDGALQTGYTIWNGEDAESDTWHVRWTSKYATDENTVDWFGSVVFYNSLLDPYASNSDYVYKWEGNQDNLNVWEDSDLLAGGDAITWTSVTNDTGGVDGFNFKLQDGIELLEFKLGSDLFEGMDIAQEGNGVEAEMITIGDQGDTVNAFVSKNSKGTYQHVQVSVPEPGTLALLGLGLAGIGLARRKQA